MPRTILAMTTTVIFFSLLNLIPSASLAAWNDISDKVTVSYTNRAIDRVKRTMFSYVTIENTSTENISGPLRLAIQDSTIEVIGAEGTTESGYPYKKITETSILANSKITYRVDFVLSRVALSFTPKLEQEMTLGDFTSPVFKEFQFVELRGRKDHEGFFPVYGKPTIGEGIVEIKIEGDVKILNVSVETTTRTTTFNSLSENAIPENGFTKHYAHISVPKEQFFLVFSITSPDGSVTDKKSNALTSKEFSINLVKSNHHFYYGNNSINIEITNQGEATDFEILTEDSENILQNPFTKTLHINKLSKETLSVPIDIPTNSDINILEIVVKITDRNNSSNFDEAQIIIPILEEPLVLDEKDKYLFAIPGSCQPISKNATLVQIIIAGTTRVNIEDIDTNTISIISMGENNIKPIAIESKDILSNSLPACESLIPDGRNDLILSYDWQKIISINPNATDTIQVLLAYLKHNQWQRSMRTSILLAN